MEFKIEAGRPFEEIQKEFNNVYPYLKIENLGSNNSARNNPVKKSCSCRKNNMNKVATNCACIINDDTTVADIVNQLCEKFGLCVTVLRKSNNLWIETFLTDSWTLEKQNRAGEQFNASLLI